MQQAPSWLGVVLVFVYFGCLIFWLPFANNQLEPRFREFVGRRLKVKIVRKPSFDRGLSWRLQDPDRGNTALGCQLFMWELSAVLILFLLPVMALLFALGAIFLLLSS